MRRGAGRRGRPSNAHRRSFDTCGSGQYGPGTLSTPYRHRDGFFPARDNLRLYWQAWVPVERRAVVGLIHGYGEHSGRYVPLVERLAARGFEVQAVDYRGHGQADGRRGHVDRFADYLDDVDRFVARLREGAGDRPIFLLGHSLGGLILARWLLESGGDDLAGVVFASPYLQLAFRPPWWKLAASKTVGRLIPWLPVDNGLTSDQLTRDPAMQQLVDRDPLYNRQTTPRWFDEATAAQAEVRARAGEIRLPALVLVPEADPIASPATGEAFAAALGSGDKTLRRFPGARHELFNEIPETREQATADLLSWLEARSG